jgi:hypothetical protein
MLCLGIDQHARQITISLRDDQGDVVLARQVSTRPEKIHAFFQKLTRERLRNGEQFIAILEVCGFNDWLVRLLRDYRCQQVILIQPEKREQRKTDRRDAAALTPGCRNSGENKQRLGRITKAGNQMARWLLAQVAYQALKQDGRLRDWYKRIKRRRGSSIARVAVMRKLATIIWHMLSKRQTYDECRAIATAG